MIYPVLRIRIRQCCGSVTIFTVLVSTSKGPVKKIFFYKIRFRFHTAKSYGSYESGSTTLGSGAFLTPGSGIWNRFFPDPESLIPDPKPQSLMCTIFTVNGHKKPICRSRSDKPGSEAEFKGRGTCSLIVLPYTVYAGGRCWQKSRRVPVPTTVAREALQSQVGQFYICSILLPICVLKTTGSFLSYHKQT
jgi:hypothetical protein